MASVLLLNGPNLNLLGTREPEVYGTETLNDIVFRLQSTAQHANSSLDHFQSNHEGAIVDKIHDARGRYDFIIINPGAFTHTSVAIRDAILGVNIPFIEVHLSNTHQRETFRHTSYFSDIAEGIIMGLGSQGYDLALQAILKKATH